jgi:hypothetical protein
MVCALSSPGYGRYNRALFEQAAFGLIAPLPATFHQVQLP